MRSVQLEEPFARVAALGGAIYNERLKPLLEPVLNGRAVAINVGKGACSCRHVLLAATGAVAINVGKGDYVVADSLKEARSLLHTR